MNRLKLIEPTEANGKTKQLLDSVQTKLGVVPNLFRVLANSPAALEGYVQFSGALAHGLFSARVREQIALTVAETNLCDYCLSAHTYIGNKLGLTNEEILAARRANAAADKTDAILKLARSIALQRGEVSEAEIHKARASGVSDAEIIETVANVAVNILTNYVNHVAKTVIDFPEVKAGSEGVGHCDTNTPCGCQA